VKKLATLILLSLTAALAYAVPASADSLVYLHNNNVWLANSNGSGKYQVTLDGTAASPYESPSEADNGTVMAVREVPGQRRRLYRMTQSGKLLNAPINTPAPGTGAIDARISPNGQLVAYWFVTTVSDPVCSFCVNVANQALISRADRFTRPDDVGNPNFGGWPSWISSSELLLTDGSPSVWYFKIGFPEATQWWSDFDTFPGEIDAPSLLDGEVARGRDRVAVVRGDNQERIYLYTTNGFPSYQPPPSDGPAPTPRCALTDPTGKFVDPTWSNNGLTLAWQEGDGVWVAQIPSNLASCGAISGIKLLIPGAKHPDFSPAANSPGPRPGCGNPGNPVACTFSFGKVKKNKKKGTAKLTVNVPGPGSLELAGKGLKPATADAPGVGEVKLAVKSKGKKKKKLKKKGKVNVKPAVTYTPVGGVPNTKTKKVKLKKKK
jgi:hypothetical protein